MNAVWIDTFDGLRDLEPEIRRRMIEAAQLVTLPAGQLIYSTGSSCSAYVMVVEGSVRVQMSSETGREIILYRVEGGGTCILTTCCLMSGEPYSAEAVAETEIRAAVVPATTFDRLLAESAVFRGFVFAGFGRRVNALLALVDDVAFGRIDQRLAQFLVGRANAGGEVVVTHQEVAVELGSAREVISRQLKEFERRGLVRLARGRIALTDPGRLTALASR